MQFRPVAEGRARRPAGTVSGEAQGVWEDRGRGAVRETVGTEPAGPDGASGPASFSGLQSRLDAAGARRRASISPDGGADTLKRPLFYPLRRDDNSRRLSARDVSSVSKR